MKRLLAPLLLAAFFFTTLFTSASAHAKLDKCSPEVGAAMATAPKEVRCWFTEELDSKPLALSVTDASGARVDNSDAKLDLDDKDHKQVFATLKPLTAGVYRVQWEVTSSDDKVITSGEWFFGIGQVSVPTAAAPVVKTPAATTAPVTTAREIVTDTSRTYIFAGLVILAGVVIALAARQMAK